MNHHGVYVVILILVSSSAGAPAGGTPIEAQHFIYDGIPKMDEDTLTKMANHPLLLFRNRQVVNSVPLQLLDELQINENNHAMTPEQRGIIQNTLQFFANAYQEIIRRQQSLLNVISCKYCNPANTPWVNFLNVMANIPNLMWVSHPTAESRYPSFVAAKNTNGVVSGVGGKIVNDEAIVEYSF